jgi:hypothetical protein
VAGSVPPVLVHAPGCFGTPPRPHGSLTTGEGETHEPKTNGGGTNEKEEREEDDVAQTVNVRKGETK